MKKRRYVIEARYLNQPLKFKCYVSKTGSITYRIETAANFPLYYGWVVDILCRSWNEQEDSDDYSYEKVIVEL